MADAADVASLLASVPRLRQRGRCTACGSRRNRLRSNLCRTCRTELQNNLSRAPRAALCRLATTFFEKQNLRFTPSEALRTTTARLLEPSARQVRGNVVLFSRSPRG